MEKETIQRLEYVKQLFNDTDSEESANIWKRAAEKYKAEGNWQEAVECYENAEAFGENCGYEMSLIFTYHYLLTICQILRKPRTVFSEVNGIQSILAFIMLDFCRHFKGTKRLWLITWRLCVAICKDNNLIIFFKQDVSLTEKFFLGMEKKEGILSGCGMTRQQEEVWCCLLMPY